MDNSYTDISIITGKDFVSMDLNIAVSMYIKAEMNMHIY